jgi:hypothetical protein
MLSREPTPDKRSIPQSVCFRALVTHVSGIGNVSGRWSVEHLPRRRPTQTLCSKNRSFVSLHINPGEQKGLQKTAQHHGGRDRRGCPGTPNALGPPAHERTACMSVFARGLKSGGASLAASAACAESELSGASRCGNDSSRSRDHWVPQHSGACLNLEQ